MSGGLPPEPCKVISNRSTPAAIRVRFFEPTRWFARPVGQRVNNRDARQILTELLVLRAQNGDSQAFTDLHALWSGDLLRLAAAHVRENRHAKEITQDAWISIARGLGRLEDPACFPRWAFRILDRRCSDWIRRRQVERERTEPLSEEHPALAEPHPSGSESDDVGSLKAAIARLDLPSRKLLHLFYDADLTVAEIAEVLDVPVGTVKSRLFVLRESLRTQLERKNHHE